MTRFRNKLKKLLDGISIVLLIDRYTVGCL